MNEQQVTATEVLEREEGRVGFNARCAELESQGMSPTDAYRRALSERLERYTFKRAMEVVRMPEND